MSVVLRTRDSKKGKVYYLDIHYATTRKKETLKIPFSLSNSERKRIAKQMAVDREQEILVRKGYIQPRPRNFVKYFYEYAKNYDKSDVRKIRNTYKHFEKVFGPTLLTTSLIHSNVQLWKDYLLDNFKGETPSTMWKVFRKVVRSAVIDGVIQEDPFMRIDIKGPSATRAIVKEVLTADELKDFYGAEVSEGDRIVIDSFVFCCFTGMTYPEVASLKLDQIDFKENKLWYYRQKLKKRNVKVTVYLSDVALAILNKYGKHRLVFNMPSQSYCSRIVKKTCKKVGISKNISWYCARHTFGTLAVMSGTDLRTVSKMMGHASVQHTQVYVNHIDKLMKDASGRMPKLD